MEILVISLVSGDLFVFRRHLFRILESSVRSNQYVTFLLIFVNLFCFQQLYTFFIVFLEYLLSVSNQYSVSYFVLGCLKEHFYNFNIKKVFTNCAK